MKRKLKPGISYVQQSNDAKLFKAMDNASRGMVSGMLAAFATNQGFRIPRYDVDKVTLIRTPDHFSIGSLWLAAAFFTRSSVAISRHKAM